jgi:hypothetical protein
MSGMHILLMTLHIGTRQKAQSMIAEEAQMSRSSLLVYNPTNIKISAVIQPHNLTAMLTDDYGDTLHRMHSNMNRK